MLPHLACEPPYAPRQVLPPQCLRGHAHGRCISTCLHKLSTLVQERAACASSHTFTSLISKLST
jgi:hypothetical protein